MATTESINPAVQSVSNDTAADYKRGVRYLLGDGVTQNLLSSQEFFRKAAEQGHADAADILSLLPLKRGASSGGWIERHPKMFVAAGFIPVFVLITGLALLLPRRPLLKPSGPAPSPVTNSAVHASGGNHGHRR